MFNKKLYSVQTLHQSSLRFNLKLQASAEIPNAADNDPKFAKFILERRGAEPVCRFFI